MSMNSQSVEPLLDKLFQGNTAEAREVLLAYEPYLRRTVRRQLPPRLRAKFDSVDIVQSVWADLLRGYRSGRWQFSDPSHFRAFLVAVTRNRFIDRVRKHRVASAREQPLGDVHTSQMPAAPEPAAPEKMQAEEMWEQMLALCPPEHKELLHLKRRGLAMEELAERTGLHPQSIRRILRNLARKLALRTGPVMADD
jgi:RNA polymerase sigma factor (sigma-70 family)